MNAKQIEIGDFLPSYPSQEDADFNSRITNDPLFSQYKSSPVESFPPSIGEEYYNHQNLVMLLAKIYPRFFVFHGAGTGKGRIISGLVNYYKTIYDRNPTDPFAIKRIYILYGASSQKQNLWNEIFNTPGANYSSKDKKEQSALRRLLKRFIKIMGYQEFANLIGRNSVNRTNSRGDKIDRIQEEMSNALILCDEAHHALVMEDVQTGFNLNLDEPPKQKVPKQPSKEKSQTTRTKESVTYDIYSACMYAFHKGFRNRIYLLTATPIINSTDEFFLLMNLLLPRERLFTSPIPPNSPEFYSKTRGMISYITSVTNDIDVSERGEPIGQIVGGEYSHYTTKIVPLPFGEFQRLANEKIKNPTTKKEVHERSFQTNERQISLFVYPDDPDFSYGKSGSAKYLMNEAAAAKPVEKPDGKAKSSLPKSSNVWRFTDRNLAETLSDYQNLMACSQKFAYIVLSCVYRSVHEVKDSSHPHVMSPREDTKYPKSLNDEIRDLPVDNKGIVYIYVPDFIQGGSAELLAVMSLYGYEIWNGISNVMTTQAPRAVLLTATNGEESVRKIFDVINSDANMFGQYVQVIIVSDVGREGININNAICAIMAGPNWNYANHYQALLRAIRTNSLELRKKLREIKLRTHRLCISTQTNEDFTDFVEQQWVDKSIRIPRNYREYQGSISIWTYNLAVVGETEMSIDLDLYLKSETKHRDTKKIVREIKRIEVGCFLNRDRNMPDAENGSEQADYTIREYTCVDKLQAAKDVLLRTEFDELDVRILKEGILSMLKSPIGYKMGQHSIVNYNGISKYPSLKEDKFLDMCRFVYLLLLEKKQIVDSKKIASLKIAKIKDLDSRIISVAINRILTDQNLMRRLSNPINSDIGIPNQSFFNRMGELCDFSYNSFFIYFNRNIFRPMVDLFYQNRIFAFPNRYKTSTDIMLLPEFAINLDETLDRKIVDVIRLESIPLNFKTCESIEKMVCIHAYEDDIEMMRIKYAEQRNIRQSSVKIEKLLPFKTLGEPSGRIVYLHNELHFPNTSTGYADHSNNQNMVGVWRIRTSIHRPWRYMTTVERSVYIGYLKSQKSGAVVNVGEEGRKQRIANPETQCLYINTSSGLKVKVKIGDKEGLETTDLKKSSRAKSLSSFKLAQLIYLLFSKGVPVQEAGAPKTPSKKELDIQQLIDFGPYRPEDYDRFLPYFDKFKHRTRPELIDIYVKYCGADSTPSTPRIVTPPSDKGKGPLLKQTQFNMKDLKSPSGSMDLSVFQQPSDFSQFQQTPPENGHGLPIASSSSTVQPPFGLVTSQVQNVVDIPPYELDGSISPSSSSVASEIPGFDDF